VRLEILEREGKFIKRSEALEFLKAFMRTVYRVVEQMNLAEEDRFTPRASFATTYSLYRGWALEPEFTLSSNGETPPTRREKWATMICCLAAQAKEAGYDREKRRGAVQPDRNRNRSTRVKRRPGFDRAGV
jgi:hypothetical protein